MEPPLLLYGELASWWPLFSQPDHYEEEAAWLLQRLGATRGRAPATILELGAGGGNTASFLTPHAALTLVDLSPDMLAVSRTLNPDATHVEGDMRTIRLGRRFDAAYIHDAVMYMTTEPDLVAALTTVRAHLEADGVAAVLPDYVTETFTPHVETGGSDAPDGRGLRYISWIHAPAGRDGIHEVDVSMLLRAPDGTVRAVHDRHVFGMFDRETWRTAFARAGFAPPAIVRDLWQRDVFLARPAG